MSWKPIEMPEDEFSDYRALIRKSGRHPEEFQHVFEERMGPNGPVEQRVVVRTRFGEKLYPAGHGTAWLSDFAADLKANYFN